MRESTLLHMDYNQYHIEPPLFWSLLPQPLKNIDTL